MSSPTSNEQNQQPLLAANNAGWQPGAQFAIESSPHGTPNNAPYHGQQNHLTYEYAQPHYGQTIPAPVIAELPASMPPAPPTTTSSQQLKDDELLAHRLQNLEIEELRKRSSSTTSVQHRPSSALSTNPPGQLPLFRHPSSQSFRPHSQSVSSTVGGFTPGSIGVPPLEQSPSPLPEVVTGPYPSFNNPHSPSDYLPIPVLQDQRTPSRPLVPLDSLSLSEYLEYHHQVPYPPQWVLLPAIATFYARPRAHKAGTSWLDTPQTFAWGTCRSSEHHSEPPIFTFTFKTTSSSLRSPKHSWALSCPEEVLETSKKLSKPRGTSWTYDLRFDSSTGMRKSEVLGHGREKSVLTTYVHAMNYDSLRFIGPDGRAYMWVSSTRLSSMNGSRYDTLRHALFAATGNIPDPLYGQIVADHTYWDGYINETEVHDGTICSGCQTSPINGARWRCTSCSHHEICGFCHTRTIDGQLIESINPACNFSLLNIPDETLLIRSPAVDPALIVATLQILKDWEKHTLREERRKDGQGFAANEEWARGFGLGIKAYWRAEDRNRIDVANEGPITPGKNPRVAQRTNDSVSTLANLADAGLKLGSMDARDGRASRRGE